MGGNQIVCGKDSLFVDRSPLFVDRARLWILLMVVCSVDGIKGGSNLLILCSRSFCFFQIADIAVQD